MKCASPGLVEMIGRQTQWFAMEEGDYKVKRQQGEINRIALTTKQNKRTKGRPPVVGAGAGLSGKALVRTDKSKSTERVHRARSYQKEGRSTKSTCKVCNSTIVYKQSRFSSKTAQTKVELGLGRGGTERVQFQQVQK